MGEITSTCLRESAYPDPGLPVVRCSIPMTQPQWRERLWLFGWYIPRKIEDACRQKSRPVGGFSVDVIRRYVKRPASAKRRTIIAQVDDSRTTVAISTPLASRLGRIARIQYRTEITCPETGCTCEATRLQVTTGAT